MTVTTIQKTDLLLSNMTENIIGSEIIRISNEVNEKIKQGEKIFNLTIGDFNPDIFPIPESLTQSIVQHYTQHHTNYPMASGMPELRKAVSAYLATKEKLNYSPEEIVVAAGARPLIFASYMAICDPGDKVVFPVPSWNNNHYCHIMGAEAISVETNAENNFMPTADDLRPHLSNASVLALCSPLNPTGTVFGYEQLKEICELIVEENQRRAPGIKPLYLIYDSIYWELTYGKYKHYNPVLIKPELKDYTIFIDGISKSLAATGVRVGWSYGPAKLINKIRAILTHVGAWSPKAEQMAVADFFNTTNDVQEYLNNFKTRIEKRLRAFYNGIMDLKNQGYTVNAIEPQAALYLTVQINIKGRKTKDGKELAKTSDITTFLLNEAKIALVPFYAFGADPSSTWYRLSVGTCRSDEVSEIVGQLKDALDSLS
ncbi:MAG TPA: aminotransferase class I/II-fold pyridoxal phosphate-dependent enzyme [Bacteroidia bacterium]|nr:aminotransferase class I/II-fold pyridoxal phosphate-dependent enzyme [Bacteroidia bacterium]HNT79702.1 aminotransferase class I/II-fold pyridoxal phosphate-dependent enzyme [Bacteroidia bacterium]